MKTKLFSIAGLLALAAPVAALPATLLPSGEWSIPTETNGLVLIDQATGQVRRAVDDGGKLAWDKTPIRTYLRGATDVAGGLAGDSGEMVVLTNPWANQMATIELTNATISSITVPQLGPVAVSEIDTVGPELMVSTALAGSGKGNFLTVLNNLPAGGNRLAEKGGYGAISQLEPLFETEAGDRMAVGRMVDNGDTTLFLARRSGSSLVMTEQDGFPEEWQLAPSVRGMDGRTLVVCWRSGDTGLRIYTLNGGIGAGSSLALTGTPEVEGLDGIGSLQRVRLAGAPDGFLVTSSDGTKGLWVRIDGGEKLFPQTTFEPTDRKLQLNGLVPVSGHGIVQLDGRPGDVSSRFASHIWNGSSWEMSKPAAIPGLLPVGTDFATLFYFNSDPFATDTAALLALETVPDWTSGSTGSPFPPSVTGETYISTLSGLASPSPRSFSAPGGSNYLLTNQHQPQLSISALRANDQILSPSLVVNPASGSFPATVEVSALYDTARYELFYRESSSSAAWTSWPGSLSVSYSSTWYFMLEDKATGVPGPILGRQWTLPAANLDDIDSDSDGVPDFVEMSKGLDPFGGADSDGDGASDLEEILEGTDPADGASVPNPRNPVPQGEGIQWLTAAFNHLSTARISLTEMIDAHDIAGALLASDDVENVTHPTLGTQWAAEPTSNSSPAQTEWAALSTGTFFDIGVSMSPNGREVIRLVDIPSPSGPSIAFTATGTDLDGDAASWIAAAQAAYATWSPVGEFTDIRPQHTMAAVLCEAMLYDQLAAAGLLGSPAIALDAFTAFPWRTQDASRTPLDRAMVAALATAGYDFSELRGLVETEVLGAGGAALRTAANAIYQRHVAQFAGNPALMHPLPALRVWIATGSLPADYTNAVTGSTLSNANAAIATIRARSAEPFRPIETWGVEVLPQGSAPPGVAYRAVGTTSVALLKPTGEPFLFEQGLGIVEGTTLSVTGFTDVTSPTGYPAMEVTALVYNSLPAASARDQDANLLDDEWERFFFGSTGNDPFSVPADSSFTLLEHYLAGTDPRGGSDPAGTPANLELPGLTIAPDSPGVFTIDFTWPEEYFDQISFAVEGSPDMSPGSFDPIPGAVVSHLGGDNYRITLPAVPGDQDYHFYRVVLSLP
ncbi:thrombospondin type 3 repeat-containing protein [Haloferula sargassicola]